MKIYSCKQQNKKDGRPMVFIQTATHDIWVTEKQFNSKGCNSSKESYVGGELDVDFYAVGEPMFNKALCTKADSVVRDFTISANPEVLANALVIENMRKQKDAEDRGSLYARSRAAAKLAAGTTKPVLAPVVVELTPAQIKAAKKAAALAALELDETIDVES